MEITHNTKKQSFIYIIAGNTDEVFINRTWDVKHEMFTKSMPL